MEIYGIFHVYFLTIDEEKLGKDFVSQESLW